MTTIGRLQQIWRYPVSSLSGESLDASPIDPDGLRGDRLWGLYDPARDEVAAPEKKRHWRPAPQIEARGTEGAPAIRLPGGDWLAADSATAREALARHFGFPAEIRRHPAPDLSDSLPTVAPRYTRNHIHLLSTASLASLQRLLPDSRLHPRRFRPNLVVELPDAASPFPETDWGAGREFQVGKARLRVAENCVRCAFTVLAQDDQPQDPAVLAAITQHNATHLGVLCDVVEPGDATLGDPVILI